MNTEGREVHHRKVNRVLYLYPLNDTGKTFIKVKDYATIGQACSNEIKIIDSYIADQHAFIQRRKQDFLIKDLNTQSGTYLNGAPIRQALLHEGDYLRIGSQDFMVSFHYRKLTFSSPLRSQNKHWNQELKHLLNYAKKDLPILLLGESGVGKEVIAKYIHENSSRRWGHFVAVNCSALKDSLIESELFGHIKGSFTGAITDRKGAFETARRGTLFLDEIGDLDIHLQPKLLRVLENQEIRPVGSDQTTKTDVRIIAATHRNLKTLISSKTFRSDLFFRLNVIQVEIPPLRYRMEDFETLLLKFTQQTQIRFSKPVIEKLKKYYWPGNIRELKNFVARTTAYCKTHVHLEDLHRLLNIPMQDATSQSSHLALSFFSLTGENIPFTVKEDRPLIKELERKAVIEAIVKFNGNQSLAASFLGLSRSTFYDRLKKYKIDIPLLMKLKCVADTIGDSNKRLYPIDPYINGSDPSLPQP